MGWWWSAESASRSRRGFENQTRRASFGLEIRQSQRPALRRPCEEDRTQTDTKIPQASLDGLTPRARLVMGGDSNKKNC